MPRPSRVQRVLHLLRLALLDPPGLHRPWLVLKASRDPRVPPPRFQDLPDHLASRVQPDPLDRLDLPDPRVQHRQLLVLPGLSALFPDRLDPRVQHRQLLVLPVLPVLPGLQDQQDQQALLVPQVTEVDS